MKKVLNYTLFSILLTFIFLLNASAECSYKERKDMLNIAKSVDISVEPIEVKTEDGSYDFKFSITGLTNDVFIKYYNNNNGIENYVSYDNLENGIYSFTDDNSLSVYNYFFVFYSNNDSCLGYELYTKKVNKPMYNIYSENINCTFSNNDDFKYCKRFLEKDDNLTLEKFNQELIKFNDSINIEEEIKINKGFIEKNIFYIIGGVIVLIVVILTFVLISKKKKEL